MRISLIYGRWCSGGAGAFDVGNLYDSKGLTGSESMFFNVARGLAERGHVVQVFCDATEEIPSAERLAGAAVFKLESSSKLDPTTDIVIAFNEPDLLAMVPPTMLRVMFQQLNDFNYARPDFRDIVDLFVFPSDTHRKYMIESCKLDEAKTAVIWNCLNIEMYDGAETRVPRSVAYCSSPDRGLHWLLEYWPLVRQRVPDATLRVYYKIDPWIQGVRDLWWDGGLGCWWENGFRARHVEECLRRLGRAGENGVTVVGPVPNKQLAREIMRAEVLAYPCDTMRWTEGFSVAIMDACAAGAVPIISDVDAIGEVYGSAADVIPGRPQSRDPRWVDAIVRMLTDDEYRTRRRGEVRAFAEKHDRKARAVEIEHMLLDLIARKAAA